MNRLHQNLPHEDWTNYPTWLVNLQLSNNQNLYAMALDWAKSSIQRATSRNGVLDKPLAFVYFEDCIKPWIESRNGLKPSMVSDLLNYAISLVDLRGWCRVNKISQDDHKEVR